MKSFKTLFAIILVAAPLAFMTGCTTTREAVYENPPGSGTYETNLVYEVDPALTNALEKIQAIADIAVPAPYQPLANPLISGVGAILIGISSWLAKKNNDKGKALSTVVKAVETLAPADADKVKDAVAKLAAGAGTAKVTKAEVTKIKS